MSKERTRRLSLFTGILVSGLTACSHHSLDDVPRPDLDLAAPAPDASVLEGEDMNRYNVATMAEVLRGRLAGVTVNTGRDGRPSIQIRGRTSVLADSEALIVVDGIESTASALLLMNPRDVARVEVLKDASAAIYGVRGANGVIQITTRRGF